MSSKLLAALVLLVSTAAGTPATAASAGGQMYQFIDDAGTLPK